MSEKEPWKEDFYHLESKVDQLIGQHAELKAYCSKLEDRLDKGASGTAREALSMSNATEKRVIDIEHTLKRADQAYTADKEKFELELLLKLDAVDKKYEGFLNWRDILRNLFLAGVVMTAVVYATTKLIDRFVDGKHEIRVVPKR